MGEFRNLLAKIGSRGAKKRLSDASGVPETSIASYAKPLTSRSARTPSTENADALRLAAFRLGASDLQSPTHSSTTPGLAIQIGSVVELEPRDLIIRNTPRHWFGYESVAGEYFGPGKRCDSPFEHSRVPISVPRWPQFIAGGAVADRVAIQPCYVPGRITDSFSYRIVRFPSGRRRRKLDGEFVLFNYFGKLHLGRQQGFFPNEGGERTIMAFAPWPWPDDVLQGPGEDWYQFEVQLKEIDAIKSGNLVPA